MAAQFFALMENPEGDTISVGPFDTREAARDWGVTVANDPQLLVQVIMRGTTMRMSRTAFQRDMRQYQS